MSKQLYLIGSLRNPEIPKIAAEIRRRTKWKVFDDWYAAGPTADDCWRDYEKQRGRSYIEALKHPAARHVFSFDLEHLSESDAAVLVMPAGKSSCLELGWMLGQGKLGYVLMDSPDRWDIMMQFSTGVFDSKSKLIKELRNAYNTDRSIECRLCGANTGAEKVSLFQLFARSFFRLIRRGR